MQSYDTSTRGNPLTSQFRPFPRFYVTDSEYRGGGISSPPAISGQSSAAWLVCVHWSAWFGPSTYARDPPCSSIFICSQVGRLPGNERQIRGFDVLHNSEARLSLGLEGDGPVTDAAIEFLQRQHDQPFFLSVSLCNPHDIYYWIMKQSVPQDPSHPETVRLMQQAHQTHFAVDPQESKFIICRRRTYYGQEGTFTWDWEKSTWRVYLSSLLSLD